MASAGTAPIQISLDPTTTGAATDDLLAATLRANPRVSDLIFSPGRTLQVQVNGAFVAVEMVGLALLSADDTRRMASHLIGNNKAAIGMLREQGYCDISYALPGIARFRVNVFIQRGSCAVVMHVIPTAVPNLRVLGAPLQLENIACLRSGLALVTGPRGSGKSSTLAALVNHINETVACHIITIEDPIEFLHNHKRSTVHQRELHSDTPSIAHAMRAALRQAPNVIVVGELKDRESMELALDAAESGHLVLSTLNTLNAAKTIERFLGVFSAAEQAAVRERLARMLRYVIRQRLIPRRQDGQCVAVFEVVTSDFLTACFEKTKKGNRENKADLPNTLDAEIERLVRDGTISQETALAHASDAARMSKHLASN